MVSSSDTLGLQFLLDGNRYLEKHCQDKKTGSIYSNDGNYLDRGRRVFKYLAERIRDKAARHHTYALIKPCRQQHGAAGYRQCMQIPPGSRHYQEYQSNDREKYICPHPRDKFSVSLEPYKEVDNGFLTNRDIAVKGRKKFDNEEKYVDDKCIGYDSPQGLQLLFAGIK